MNEKTKLFVRTKFEEYYRHARISIPKDFWMREWGFVFLDHYFPGKLVMRRHKSFATEKELVNYLRENAPAHAYHSAAIYKYPAADMANKGWLGADLIFDLDADHIVSETELEQYSYEDLLVQVKKETEKLIDFMLNDFGFHEKDMELVFSGSRGYHIHIGTEEVRGLGSRERREIVDYVMGTGLDMKSFIDTQEEHSGKMRGREDLRLVPEGWGKRLLKGLIDLLHEIAEMEEEKAIEKLKQIGELKDKNARNIIKIAKDDTVMVRIEKGQIPRFGKQIWEGITKAVTKTVRVKSADRVDEPVTSDIKRLIRLPNSLHGKSSLAVKPLRIETFKAFNPLDDAVVFGDSPVEITVSRNSSIKLKGEIYKVEQGEVVSVPEHVAVYFMCRGVAEI
ncbi:MAG TPA: DNA primase catalytic subunit PriS [Methanophagales archaeon]|nr:DNA primase catalytic subunit PriS [Methanophagales archaeon]